MDFQIPMQYLRKSDVSIMSISEPISDVDSPMGEFIVSLIGNISTLEHKWIISRSKMGLRTRAKNGLWTGGTTPYGYDYDRSSGKLVINEKESEVVNLIYEKYLEYQSLTLVANYLNNRGIHSKKGNSWSKKIIGDILQNKSHLGYHLFNDIKMEKPELQIINNDLFERVQKLREERKVLSPNFGGKYSKVYKMEKDGTLVGEIHFEGGFVASGIVWTGSYFWTCGGYKLQKWTMDGKLVGGIYPPAVEAWDIDWDGQYLLTICRTCEEWADEKVFQIEILDDSL
jgi:hypothetical protein